MDHIRQFLGTFCHHTRAKRRELYAEMQRIVRDEGGQVIPLFNNYLLACNEKLEHGPMLRYADLDGYKLPERWWFAG